MKATCKQCGVDEPDHRDDCHHGLFARLAMTAAVVRDQEVEIRRLRDEMKSLEERAERAEATLQVLTGIRRTNARPGGGR